MHPIKDILTLPAGPWPTLDPFLFCVHHRDAYPAGDDNMGVPQSGLAGRRLGQDFSGKDGWSMYHGASVPGFPQHPHRGFETVTIARQGLIDHADSLGASARFGHGDVQWMTAGRGIVHSEMFPLINRASDNPTELFQIWLNLPSARKLADPHFAMFWADSIPETVVRDGDGRQTVVKHYAGAAQDGLAPPSPPPASWAADPSNGVRVWTIRMEPGANWELPAAPPTSNRRLYYFSGNNAEITGQQVNRGNAITLASGIAATIRNGSVESEFLLLEGRAIGEPVEQYGPFVMNTRAELQEAFADYQRTRFGGWPWPSDGPVHGPLPDRFARTP